MSEMNTNEVVNVINETEEESDFQKLLDHVLSDENVPKGLLENLRKLSSEGYDISSILRKISESEETDRAIEISKSIHSFFDKKNWNYSKLNQNGSRMLLGFKMKNSTIRLEVSVESEAECIRFNVELFQCLEEYRLAVSDYIANLNYPIRYGAFHVDKDDNAISYRYSVSYKNLPFSEEAFENCIDACIIGVDENVKMLGKIANGNFTEAEKRDMFDKMKLLAIALNQ